MEQHTGNFDATAKNMSGPWDLNKKFGALKFNDNVPMGHFEHRGPKEDTEVVENWKKVEAKNNTSVQEVELSVQEVEVDVTDDGGGLKEKLLGIMESVNLHDEAIDTVIPLSAKYIKAYFYQKEPEFARLLEYRIRGWHENKEKGDAHFQAQRQSADASSLLGEKYFFKMMIEIAREMHEQTSVLSPNTASGKIKVLDVCMAPGGFTAAALEEHPRGELYAITLPKSMGGHQALVPMDKLRGLKELDITMLRELADGDEIPKTHPECANFRIEKPYKFHKFDLAFCDGMVLRTHKRATYREQTERLRLTTSQLIIAMTRVANGGTIALLQHKLDSWMPARIVCTFSRFSKVQVFKPQKKHASRSSFYMVAKYIDTDSEGFRECLKRLREDWWEATFGGEGGTGRCADGDDEDVLGLLREHGDSLVKLGRPVWKIQADALAKTEYAGSE